MSRQPIPDDHPYRSFLVPYDRDNPDPRIPQDLIGYIEGRQPGLTPRDHAKLDEIEWFTFHTFTKHLNAFAIPGLRPQKLTEVRWVKRFNPDPYWTMINTFLDYVPSDRPEDRIEGGLLPAYRLTGPDGDHFYPVEYNRNFAEWRKRLADNAAHFRTSIGFFDHGRFVVSDGREIEFADMAVASFTRKNVPPDF